MSILAGYGTIPLKTETRIIKSNIHRDPENSKKKNHCFINTKVGEKHRQDQ